MVVKYSVSAFAKSSHRYKFAISNKQSSVEPHRLAFCPCARIKDWSIFLFIKPKVFVVQFVRKEKQRTTHARRTDTNPCFLDSSTFFT